MRVIVIVNTPRRRNVGEREERIEGRGEVRSREKRGEREGEIGKKGKGSKGGRTSESEERVADESERRR